MTDRASPVKEWIPGSRESPIRWGGLAASGNEVGRVNPRLWLIGTIGGLVGLGFLIRSRTHHCGLRTGTQLGAPNSATVVTDPMASGYDDGPVSPELALVDPDLRARLAMRVSVPTRTVEPLHAKSAALTSTDVPAVPIVSDYYSPVHPEPVLVDPVVRDDLAMHESVRSEISVPPYAEADVVALTDVREVPTVLGDGGPVSPEPVLVDSVLRAYLAEHVPKPSAARRLLVAVAAAVALSAAASSGVFVGLLLSGDRVAALIDAAATPPTPPVPPKAAAATAAKPANPVSTRPPISRPRTAAAEPQAGVSEAPSSRLLAWAPVANATAYTVEITRNGESVYTATTTTPNVRVPSQWRHAGRTITLSPGTYHWYVWPVVRSGTTTRQLPAAVVASKLEIAR